jgi:hypothetical protein
LQIRIRGVALAAAMVAVGGGCGSGGSGGQAGALDRTDPGAERIVIGHRFGPARVEPGSRLLPARPCATIGEHGTTTIRILPETSVCARAKPGERLLFVNDTGIGPEAATAVRVQVGNYRLRIAPQGKGLIRAPVETYLGPGSHQVQVAGAPGATVLLLPARRGD